MQNFNRWDLIHLSQVLAIALQCSRQRRYNRGLNRPKRCARDRITCAALGKRGLVTAGCAGGTAGLGMPTAAVGGWTMRGMPGRGAMWGGIPGTNNHKEKRFSHTVMVLDRTYGVHGEYYKVCKGNGLEIEILVILIIQVIVKTKNISIFDINKVQQLMFKSMSWPPPLTLN